MSVRRAGLAFWGLAGAMVAVYLAIVLWSLPEISAAAGGLVPFDLRPAGYSAAEARAFLGALSTEGRALYLGRQAALDLVYPALLAAVLVLAFRHLAASWGPAWRAVLVALPLAGAGFDYLENLRVRRLLIAGPAEATDAMIAAASLATVIKSVLSSLAFAALVVALAVQVLGRRRGGDE